MGHNESNTRRLNEAPAGEEARIIRRALATIEKATGTRPVGWLGSGLQETWDTLDLLAAEGCEYVCDWTNDDQPYIMTLEGGRRLVSMPYSHEINDKPAFERLHRTADEFREMICRQFDVLYREGAESGRVMAIALHPYLTGVPHRIDAFDAALAYICRHEQVWKATGSEIARHYLAQDGSDLRKGVAPWTWRAIVRALLAGALLLGAAHHGSRRPPAPPRTVTVGTVGSASANLWPVFIGINKGFFAAENLKVDVVYVQSSAQLVQQLTAGSLDICHIDRPGRSDPRHRAWVRRSRSRASRCRRRPMRCWPSPRSSGWRTSRAR